MPWQARSGRLFLAIPAAMGYHAASGPPKGLPCQILNVMTPVLNPTTRIYVDADACPVKDEIYRVAARHGLPVSVVAGNFIRVPPDPHDRADRGGFRHGRRRRLDCGTRRKGRYRHHLRYPAGEPLRQGRRRGDRAERQAVLGAIDRDDAGGPQPDDRPAGRQAKSPAAPRASRRATARRSCRRSTRPSGASSASAPINRAKPELN